MDDIIKPPQPQHLTTLPHLPQEPERSTKPVVSRESGYPRLKSFFKLLLILILICGAAYGGYYYENVKAKKVENTQLLQINSLNKQLAALNQKASKSTSTNNSTSTDIYSGWKSYCSKVGSTCLKYPTNWVFSQTNPGSNTAASSEVNSITSPSGAVKVVYKTFDQTAVTTKTLATSVINSVSSTTSDFNVISQINTSKTAPITYSPQLFIYPASSANYPIPAQYIKLTTGATLPTNTVPNIYEFINPKVTNSKQYQDINVVGGAQFNNQFSSNTDAQAWLNSVEVKTATQILESFNYNT